MGAKSLEIIARHDRVKVLDEWEALYRRLSNEFIEAKERKQRRRMERKLPGRTQLKIRRQRIARTGELTIDQRYATEEQLDM
jgi:hypothetical protein